MILYICLKGLILAILFWECESKFFEIKGLKSQRRMDIGTLNTENVIEDINMSDPKQTEKGTSEDSQVIRLTNITIHSQTTEGISANNTNNTSQQIYTTTKIDKDNNTLNSNEVNLTNATIQDNKPLQETPVFKSIEESIVPVTVVHDTGGDNLTTVTALTRGINNASTLVDIIRFPNTEHDNRNVTTVSNAIPLQTSTDEAMTEDSQLDINIKMKASDDSLSIIDIKTMTKQSNDKIDSTSISNMLKKFANRFMKLMKGFFSFKRFNDDDDENFEDKYSLYVPISEDVSRSQYNSAEKQHVNILREGTLSLLGNDRNHM